MPGNDRWPTLHRCSAHSGYGSRRGTAPSTRRAQGLNSASSQLDEAFADGEPDPVFKAVRAAERECNLAAPDLLPELRRAVSVKGEVACLDSERMIVALDGAPRRDAFRQAAVIEGLFAERSPEVAALYLHMAGRLGAMAPGMLREMQRPFGKQVSGKNYFVFPEELYGRACLMDPHPEAFSQWLRWARGMSIGAAEAVARAWTKALPDAIEPLLFLMEQSRSATPFPPLSLIWIRPSELTR